MNFAEAMELMRLGKKVYRPIWKQEMYLTIVDDEDDTQLKCFSEHHVAFGYDNDMLLSDGWYVLDMKGGMSFSEAIKELMLGRKIVHETFSEGAYVHVLDDMLVKRYMAESTFIPTMACLFASDWHVYGEIYVIPESKF